MSDEFNLRALVRDVCDEQSGELSNDKIAHEVLDRISPDDYVDALRQSLRFAVMEITHGWRLRTTIRATDADESTVVPIGPRPSRKVQAIRAAGDVWRKSLEERYAIGNGVTAPLGDLTRDQLLLNIKVREEQARSSAAKALQLRGLHDLCERHDVARVRDLPEQVLASILTRSAA